MKINRHNLTIVRHCASKVLQGTITNGLQFTKTGTTAVNGVYSVSVTALKANDKEPYPGCITKEAAQALLVEMPEEGKEIRLAGLKFIDGVPPVINLPPKPAAFEIYINADYLLRLVESVRDFQNPSRPDHDPVVRFQFISQTEPVRMDARNASGQTWEALLMPRKPRVDTERFTEPAQAIPVPPPPPAPPVDPLAEAMALAAKLMGQ